jgi:hypothetical protein
MSWAEDEAQAADDRAEVRRLFRRAAARPVLTLGLTLFLVGGLVGWRARKPPENTSRVVMRVTEGSVKGEVAPAPNKDIRAYINDVAFSNRRLLAIMESFSLSPGRRKKDPIAAVQDFREEIQIEVWRNYFLGLADAGERRTARVAIAYTDSERERAVGVAQALGQLVIESARSSRVSQLDNAAHEIALTRAALEEELKALNAELVRAQLEARRKGTPDAAVALVEAQRQRQRVAGELADVDKRRAAVGLAAALEQNQLGLDFNVVDDGRLPPRPRHAWPMLVLFGLIMFVLILPIGAISVAALDSRVDLPDDVRRLGLQPLGHIGPFPGDDVATLRARERSS